MKFLVSAILVLAACETNQSGNLRATKTGDTSHPLAKQSPIEEVRAACGNGTVLDGRAVVHREPYLQQVTPHSAMVGWVSMEGVGERVDAEAFDGHVAVTARATSQKGAQREAGEEQMWATLEGLSPRSVYCYQLANNGSALTEPTGFRTAPDRASTEPIRFLAFGDSGGGGADQMALRDRMLEYPFDLIIHTGDLAYDNGTIGQIEDTVFGPYRELFKNLPFFPAAGNHDYETQGGAPFRHVFALPENGESEKWYSYDWGRVHFAALDTESDYATQAAWLDADLAASNADWKVVYMHRPPYSSGHHGSDTSLRRHLAPVFERHGVQLVLAGHDHHYERMHPQNGVAYVLTGGGGRGTRGADGESFTAFVEEVIHFVVVEIIGDELVVHAIDATGQEFDSMVVPRTRS
jgi:3',5'-cyclic AMP phosphodiesterase CpdA